MNTKLKKIKELIGRCLPRKLQPYMLAEQRVWRKGAGRIIAGPFVGMVYVKSSVCSALMPKLLGTYELELHERIDAYCKEALATVIDIGAAEGYYAVGFAWRCTGAKVVAFESDAGGRALIDDMAELNGVSSRIEIRGHCTGALLQAELRRAPSALIIMDVEGGEAELLRPDLIPELLGCRILVELHEFIVPGIRATLASRFGATHRIVEIHARDRALDDLAVRSRLLDRWLLKLTREFRPAPMSWFELTPDSACQKA